MKHLSLFVLSAVCCIMSVTSAADSTEWRAGTSRVKITPEKDMWMAGYASRNKPSEGVEQDLYAKALAVDDQQGGRLVIVTTDLIGIPRGLRDNVNAAVKKKYGLAPESVLLNASHTHCGPELRMGKAAIYGLPPERVAQCKAYLQQLETKIIRLIGEALDDSEPANLHYSFGRAGFAMNRRLITMQAVRNSPNPTGPVDHQVPVLKVTDADGKLKTVLFGYACHNTTMGFYKFFGDYAGYAQQFVEEYHPGANAMFITGCGGDQNPYPRRELRFAEYHGRALAGAVETALRVAQPKVVEGPLRVAADNVTLEFQTPPNEEELQQLAKSSNYYDQRRATALLDQLQSTGDIPDTYDYPISVARFGDDLTLIGLSGEVVVDYSLRFKIDYANRGAVWVAGYSHDVFGYVPSRRVLLEGGYEGGGAMRYTTLPGPFAQSVEQRILDGVSTLVEATD